MSQRNRKNRRLKAQVHFDIKEIPLEKPIFTSEPTPEDLSAFLPDIKAAYRDGRRMGLHHIVIAAIPATSEYAKLTGLKIAGPMLFQAMDPPSASKAGLLPEGYPIPESNPPVYSILFASPDGVDMVMCFDGSTLMAADSGPRGPHPLICEVTPEEWDRLDEGRKDRLGMITGILPIIRRQLIAFHRDYSEDPVILVCDLSDRFGREVALKSGDVEGVHRELAKAKRTGTRALTVLAMPAELAARVVSGHCPTVTHMLLTTVPPEGTLFAFALADGRGTGLCVPLSAIDAAGPDDTPMTEVNWHYT